MDGSKEVTVIERDVNFGLSKSIIDCVIANHLKVNLLYSSTYTFPRFARWRPLN
jgi:hypothetical protein